MSASSVSGSAQADMGSDEELRQSAPHALAATSIFKAAIHAARGDTAVAACLKVVRRPKKGVKQRQQSHNNSSSSSSNDNNNTASRAVPASAKGKATRTRKAKAKARAEIAAAGATTTTTDEDHQRGGMEEKDDDSRFNFFLEAACCEYDLRCEYDLSRFKRVMVVGVGKAAVSMAKAIEELVFKRMPKHMRVERGIIVTKHGHATRTLEHADICEASHPIPALDCIAATQKLMERIARYGRDSHMLMLFVLTGGSSSLLCAPATPLTLDDIKQTNQVLLASGATIQEVNVIRTQLSKVKGGRLLNMAGSATVLSLVLSDVIGDNLELIGSGPTAIRISAQQVRRDAINEVVEKYQLNRALHERVLRMLRAERRLTPSMARHKTLVIGNNRNALLAARRRAEHFGYQTLILTTMIEGEACHVARWLVSIVHEVILSGQPVGLPACILVGGETTVTLPPGCEGLGGRNQELALAAALELEKSGCRTAANAKGLDIVILSGGTDGTDGPTDAAGAIVGRDLCARAAACGLSPTDYLARHDAYHFFQSLRTQNMRSRDLLSFAEEGLVKTGATGTNVADVMVMCVGRVDCDANIATAEPHQDFDFGVSNRLAQANTAAGRRFRLNGAHGLVSTKAGRQKWCALCATYRWTGAENNRERTRLGFKSTFECSLCGVALCREVRGGKDSCFAYWHTAQELENPLYASQESSKLGKSSKHISWRARDARKGNAKRRGGRGDTGSGGARQKRRRRT